MLFEVRVSLIGVPFKFHMHIVSRITIYPWRLNHTESLIIDIHARFNHTETGLGTNHTETVFGKNSPSMGGVCNGQLVFLYPTSHHVLLVWQEAKVAKLDTVRSPRNLPGLTFARRLTRRAQVKLGGLRRVKPTRR